MRQITGRTKPRFWIGSAARDHVLRGVKGGFCQLSHGRPEGLRRMCRGDWIAYYSGRDSSEGTACQRFTAIGKITGEDVYPVTVGTEFHPFRRDVQFCRGREAEIEPLIPTLSFIKDKKHWGLPFRRGYLEVSPLDFSRVAEAMLGKRFEPAVRCRRVA